MTVKLAPWAVRSACSGAQWALPCNPRAPREARRRFHNLRHQVEMAVPGTRVRLHRTDLADFDSEYLGGFFGGLLSLQVTLAAPHDQRATDPEHRRRVLDHNLKRSQSPGGDDIHR